MFIMWGSDVLLLGKYTQLFRVQEFILQNVSELSFIQYYRESFIVARIHCRATFKHWRYHGKRSLLNFCICTKIFIKEFYY